MARQLMEAGDSLAEMAERGRPADGHRELVIVWPYILRYRIAGDRVIILRVRHGARLAES